VKATEFSARAVNYRVAQQILQNDRPAIFLYNTLDHAAVSSSLTGMELTPTACSTSTTARFR
jgi:ABC-type transport system substrate-binding protein